MIFHTWLNHQDTTHMVLRFVYTLGAFGVIARRQTLKEAICPSVRVQSGL